MINTTYEPFSKEPEYLELNRQFIQCVVPHVKGWNCIVDLACGTGTLTALLLTEMMYLGESSWRGTGCPTVLDGLKAIGIDISRGSLKIARDHFAEMGVSVAHVAGTSPREEAHEGVRLMLVEASGDCLPIPEAVADALLLGNAIHCFSDKGKLLREVHRVLRPAGLFAFNSSFYAGTMVKGTERFYEEWMKYALRYAQRKDAEYRNRGIGGGLRKRGCGRPAFSNRWLSQSEYGQALEEYGFDIVSASERTIQMSRTNFETVGAYAELASVLLSGYPVELACEALERAVAPAFEAVGAETVPRSWLELIGVKR